jgi:beta-N-acetylhexosaminidase
MLIHIGEEKMKSKILIFLVLVLVLVGCNEKKEEKKEKDGIDSRVEEVLNNMTLEEKIGQMIIISYRAPSMDSTLKKAIEEVKPGGFILFAENMSSYDGTLKMIKEIKALSEIPMFISIDEEGGRVQRLLNVKGVNVSNVSSMYSVGEKNDLDLTYNVGKLIAEELRVFGINLDFAPDIDVFSDPNNTVIGNRSFGSDKELVAKHGLALAKGLEDNGVIAVYKHFPGHGNTSVDSHYSLPVLDLTKEALEEVDLYPFREAIKNNANIIMIGHLAIPGFTDNNDPASLSKQIITDYLKNRLGYKGIVITDALDMGALTNYYPDTEICGKAVEAGSDILLMPKSSRTCLKSVQNAVKNGTVTEEQINESVKKILKLKYEKIEKDYDQYLDKSYLGNQEHQDIINKIKG